MSRKRKITSIVTGVLLGAGLLGGASIAGAQGYFGADLSAEDVAQKHQTMFERHSLLLGVSVDSVKDGWSRGLSLADLAKESGITEEQLKAKFETERQSRMTAMVASLVEKGIITQAQADARLAVVNDVGGGFGMGRGGMGGRHRGSGF